MLRCWSDHAFFQLRNIAELRSVVSTSQLETIIHSFISACRDYCNCRFYLPQQVSIGSTPIGSECHCLQLARLCRRIHITPILATLHWLSIKFRIDFKIALTTYKALHGHSPAYIGELVSPYSTGILQGLLAIPRSKRKMMGGHAFVIVAPRLWNDFLLKFDLQTLWRLKWCLKTNLFRQVFKWCVTN